MRLIGLVGYAGSGKDEVAKILCREHGFGRVAFADPLREMLYALNPIVLACDGFTRVQNIVDNVGWDKAKRIHPEIRELLQRLGTEAGRNVLGQNIWVDMGMMRALEMPYAVITDCRFENEACEILAEGGEIWEIIRPGVAPVNMHASDAGLCFKYASRRILNDGTLSDLAYATFGAVAS